MTESVRRLNRDGLPLYIAAPRDDLELFKNRIGTRDVIWLTSEEVISANPAINMDAFHALHGRISQQIVKAEFWRESLHENCIRISVPVFQANACSRISLGW